MGARKPAEGRQFPARVELIVRAAEHLPRETVLRLGAWDDGRDAARLCRQLNRYLEGRPLLRVAVVTGLSEHFRDKYLPPREVSLWRDGYQAWRSARQTRRRLVSALAHAAFVVSAAALADAVRNRIGTPTGPSSELVDSAYAPWAEIVEGKG